MNKLWSDLRYALRAIRRNPGFAAVGVLALALGIGANTAIFAVVEAVILRPLPYRDPRQLVSVKSDLRRLGISNVGMSVPEFEDFRDRAGAFQEISYVWPMDGNLTGAIKPERIEALAVSNNYFRLLGVTPLMGRAFGKEEMTPSFAEGTVMSYEAWQTLFGGDPHILGRKISMDYDPYRIIGVLPPGFKHPGRTIQGDVQFWITAGFQGGPFVAAQRRGERRLPSAIARLKPGLSPLAAQAKLDAFAGGLRQQFAGDYPEAAGWAPRVTGLQQDLTGNTRLVLLLMLGAVGLVLLICCASLANLLLARGTSRRREMAVRSAIGAHRGDLVRNVVVESLVLALVGGAAGVAVFAAARPVLLRLIPVSLPHINEVGLNAAVLGFTLLASVGTGLLFGLAPALQVSKFNLLSALGGRGTAAGGAQNRARNALVVCQIAFSLMLLAGAGLLLRSFWNVLQVDPGFNPRNMLVASIWLPPPSDPRVTAPYRSRERRTAFIREILRRTRELAGVELAAAGGGQNIPLVGWNASPFGLEDDTAALGESTTAQMTSVTPDFFRAMQTPLVEGRAFTESDDGDNHVALIDQTMARRFWRNQSPIGRRIRLGPAQNPQWWTIVGVVGNIRTDGFDTAEAPHIYFPLYQRMGYGMSVFLRVRGNPEGLAQAVRRAVQSIDPDLPIFGVRSMEAVASRSLAQRRFALEVMAAFALLALGLAAMGIYGVTAFAVGQRTQEIGIRMALGAGRGDVLLLIVKQGLGLLGWGLAVGTGGALMLTRYLATLLFGATSGDPLTYASVSGLLALVTVLACYLPARRALRVDPMTALRSE